MPKGARGCFACGEPTCMNVMVWLRDQLDTKHANGCRRQRTITSVVRNFCEAHAIDAYAESSSYVVKLHRHHGCCVCGERAERRIQVWLRTTNEYGAKSLGSVSRGYCVAHADEIYEQATNGLGRETYRKDDRMPGRWKNGIATAAARRLAASSTQPIR